MSDQKAAWFIEKDVELELLNNEENSQAVRIQVDQTTTTHGQHSHRIGETAAVIRFNRKPKRTQKNNLQKAIIHELTSIIDEPVVENGLPKLQAWLDDPRIKTLQDLTEELNYWEELTTLTKPKTFLFSTKIQPHFGRMLKNNTRYQPYLECFIAHFAAVNEKIMPERNAPIHYAVESLNISFLEWLLNHQEKKCEVNSRNKWAKTALFLLCEQYKRSQQLSSSDKVDDIRRCIVLLLGHEADFNICSDRLELPFELLTKNQSDENRQFLQICERKFGNAIAIGKKNTQKQRMIGFHQPTQPVNITVELLEIYLRFKDEEKFTREFEKFEVVEDNAKAVIKLLLHTAVELDLGKSVKRIVACAGQKIFQKLDEDNKSSEMVYRVQLKGLLKKACNHGNVATLNLLLSNITDRVLINDDPILVLTLNRAQELGKRQEERTRVLQFAEILARDPRIYLSKTDNNGNTAIHVALKFGFSDIALSLLQQRYAFLGARNKDYMTPLDYARYDFWKQYLDQCVSIEAKRSNHRSRIQINLSGFDRNFFFRQAKNAAQKNSTKENMWRIVEKATEKNVTNRRHHPVVTEMDPIYQIAQSKELKPLLLHPVVYTFIQVKWLRLVKWKYLNFIAILATVICFCLHSIESCIDRNFSITLYVLSWIGAAYIIIREIVQILFLRRMYFSSFENFLDVATVVCMIIVLQDDCRSILSSLTVISFALQFTVLAGSLPFNALSTYMYMFKKVSLNFMKSFLLFIPLLLAFIYGFFLSYNDKTAKHNYAADEIPFNRFGTFNDAALKTLIMTTGEYEGAGLDFSGGKIIIFVLFVFFAPIVILNLINGLAVSDITAIKQQSKLISIHKKVLLLQRYERGINNMPIEIIRRLFPNSFFNDFSYKVLIKPKEFRKILVSPYKARWEVVPIVPISQGAQGLYIKPLRFPLFLTLDKHVMDETLRIVDESIILKNTIENKRLEISSANSGTINMDVIQEEMLEELSR